MGRGGGTVGCIFGGRLGEVFVEKEVLSYWFFYYRVFVEFGYVSFFNRLFSERLWRARCVLDIMLGVRLIVVYLFLRKFREISIYIFFIL